jgi:hypothetical protein
LAPLVEREGGGGVATGLDAVTQRFAGSRQPLADGRETVTPWGETPGTKQVADMVRGMVPIVLGGSG